MNYEDLFADRIGGNQFGKSNSIYKFEKIKRAKQKVKKLKPGLDVLDFGVGEPDKISPQIVRDTLKHAVDKIENRGYADNGIDIFSCAAANYMKNFFNVNLDSNKNINHCLGIKSALSMLPMAFINPGDIVFQTVPGYPVMATHTRYLGGEVVDIPLLKENNFLPNIEEISPELSSKCKLFYINYPNNPTGAVATDKFYDDLIEYAKKFNILIVQDAPYATLVYNGEYKSILERPGAIDCAVELHSMSKSFNMTGWRLGFFCGAEWAVNALAHIKDNCDSGQFKAIQEASAAVISDLNTAKKISNHYEKRLKKMVQVLKNVGFDATMPSGTFYLYVKAPLGAGDILFKNAEQAALYLIETQAISTVPWDDTGSYLRFGAVFESSGEEDDDRIMKILEDRLLNANLKF